MDKKQFDMIVTARDTGDRLTYKTQLELGEKMTGISREIAVKPEKQFQKILGFGGAFTEAGGYVLQQLSPQKQAEVIDAYFDFPSGHGYTLCRTHINSCDFSLGNYAYAEVPGDTALDHFSIERDRQYLLPMIRAALERSDQPVNILASPWSPPPWMKTNGQMNHGGKLLPEYRQAWADYYGRYIREYEKEGVSIWGVSVQNEPMATQVWDSCVYSAVEERDFVRDFLGPSLEDAGLSHIKIIVWDHNRDLVFRRANRILQDPEAAKFVWGVGFHWYEVPNRFRNLTRVHRKHPQTNLLFTEGCQVGGPHLGEWNLGEKYAFNMIHDLNRWTVGWIDWNMLLDERGGPNHVGNYCSAQIIADTRNDELLYQSSYYYFGHIARFVRPGAVRVGCHVRDRKLLACAFQNADGKLAIIVLNPTDAPRDFNLSMGGQSMAVPCPAHSILTLIEREGA